MSIRDLFVEIGMDIEDDPLRELDKSIDDIKSSLKKFDTGGIDDTIDGVDDLNDEFKDLEDTVEDTADEIKRMGNNGSLGKLEADVGKADKSMGMLKKSLVALGGALAAIGIANAFKDFTVSAIQAAASAEALNAQFDQVFTGLEKSATDSLNKIAEETGILPSRLQGSFTQMAAFAKTTGVDTADALALTERATMAAADSAAFYDRSIEEVTENLQSFLKGNYENDAALGISATETTRNAKANELYSKSFKDLDEAQKQLTLLAMVEDGNELAGALGQAARESDQFENQLGNLKQAWQDFLVKAGTPILEQAVTVLKWLSEVLSDIDPGPFFEWISKGFDGLLIFKDIIVDTINSIESVGDISEVLQGLGIPPEIADAYQQFGEIVMSVFETGKSLVSSFVEEIIVPLMPKAQEFIGTAMGFIGGVVGGAMNLFSALASIVKGLIEKVIVPLFPVAQEVISTAIDIISPVLRVVGSLFKAITAVIKFLVEEVIVPLMPLAANNIKQAWTVMKPILDAIATAFDAIATAVEWVIEKLGKVGEAIKNFDVGDKISGAVSWISNKLPGFEIGLGRVPYDDMPALLHKDEAVLPAEEADMLRNAGILKGDGTNPSLDFGGANDYVSTAPVTTNNSTTTVQAPVQIIVQGGKTNEQTTYNIKEGLEEFFGDLRIIMATPREG